MARTLLGLNGRPRGRVGYSRPISGEAAGSTTMSPRVLLMMATSSASSVAGTLNFRIECPLLDPQQPFPSFCIISQQSDKPIMSEQTWFEQRQTKFRATVNFSLGQRVFCFADPSSNLRTRGTATQRSGDAIMALSKAAEQSDSGLIDHARKFWPLVIGSIGVVFGDIGTSPLYAFREAVNSAQGVGISNREAVVGVLSMILWTLTLIVTMKYVTVLLRLDNKGEGGTFALMALGQSVAKRSAPLILGLGIAGAAFFYGDAVITPAISVLSAVEGLELVSPAFQKFVMPLAALVLIGLFAMQAHGTAKVANVFGPIMIIWFVAMALAA